MGISTPQAQTHTNLYIYIYIYRERERERERERVREKMKKMTSRNFFFKKRNSQNTDFVKKIKVIATES